MIALVVGLFLILGGLGLLVLHLIDVVLALVLIVIGGLLLAAYYSGGLRGMGRRL